MSTRSTIRITEGRRRICLYHHHDGYPEGVGATLLNYLNSEWKYQWDMFFIANRLVKGYVTYAGTSVPDEEFEVTNGQHGDEEYAYLINCKKCTVTCYKIGWDDKKWSDDKIVFVWHKGEPIPSCVTRE